MTVGDGGIRPIGQVHEHRLVALDLGVAYHKNADLQACLSGREREGVTHRVVVWSGRGRAVSRGIVDRNDSIALRRQGDREDHGRTAEVAVALLNRRVADRDGRGIVVLDRTDTLRVREGRVGGVRQVEEEGFVQFVDQVAGDLGRDGLFSLAGLEGQRAVHPLVVADGRGCAIGRCVVYGGCRHALGGQGHSEHRLNRASITLHNRYVIHRQSWQIVVRDGTDSLAIRQRSVTRIGEVQEERFVQLDGCVAIDDNDDGLLRLSRREGQLAVGRLVVDTRGGGPVGCAVAYGHLHVALLREGHSEHGLDRAGVALSNGHIVDRYRRGLHSERADVVATLLAVAVAIEPYAGDVVDTGVARNGELVKSRRQRAVGYVERDLGGADRIDRAHCIDRVVVVAEHAIAAVTSQLVVRGRIGIDRIQLLAEGQLNLAHRAADNATAVDGRRGSAHHRGRGNVVAVALELVRTHIGIGDARGQREHDGVRVGEGRLTVVVGHHSVVLVASRDGDGRR